MRTFIILVSLAVLLVPSVASANLLANPGFESTGEQGHTTGWTVDYNNNIFGTNDNPRTGTYAARNFNDGGMYQEVAVTAGEAYTLRGYAFIPEGEGGSPWGTYIGVKFLRENDSSALSWEKSDFKDLERAQWNEAYSGVLVVPEDAVVAQVRFGTWASAPYEPVAPIDFDDFDFSPIPEPTSLVLLGTGLVGLVGLTRKRK